MADSQPPPSGNLIAVKLRNLAKWLREEADRVESMTPEEYAVFQAKVIAVEEFMEACKPIMGAKSATDMMDRLVDQAVRESGRPTAMGRVDIETVELNEQIVDELMKREPKTPPRPDFTDRVMAGLERQWSEKNPKGDS
jgi:hypothetical protein